MSMSREHAEELKNELAIVCCRTEEGTIIEAENLEDPAIFPDLEDSGLLKIPSDCLKIGQILGKKLKKTIDSLTPITPDMIDGDISVEEPTVKVEKPLVKGEDYAVLKINKSKGETVTSEDLENPENFAKLEDSLLLKLDSEVLKRSEVIGKVLKNNVIALSPIKRDMLEGMEEKKILSNKSNITGGSGVLKIKIAEGKGIDIEIPMGIAQGSYVNEESAFGGVHENLGASGEIKPLSTVVQAPAATVLEPKKVRTLTRKHFKIANVEVGDTTKIEGTTLTIRKNICEDAVKISDLVEKIELEIITEDKYHTYSETIMDVQPIATKEGDSKLGTGVTRVLDGIVMVVTGTDANGVQIGEFGSSEGMLDENIMWGRPGAPDKGDIFIKTQVTIAEGTNMERPGPLAAHKATDFITQEIREAMKKLDESLVVNTEDLVQCRRPGKKKVVIVKEIMGQGAMHDNLILPVEPVGILGGKPNVDIGNVPVVLSPLEVLDGGIHALTCIGPASKECSRHYFREPLVIEAMANEEIDLCGVVFIGSPQINAEKFYVSERLGMTIETMDVDGAIVTTEGFGNNHIDFASHIEQIGMRGIPVVGMSFCAVQGALVVGNKYMKYMVDNNKSEAGIENEVLCCNTLCKEDAVRALSMLNCAMEEEDVKAAEKKWNPNVKENNLEAIEKELNVKIDRVDNENSIPMSEKRKEKYSTK